MSDSERFDWNSESNAIALHEQKTTAVYWNSQGAIVIRQEAGPLDSEDPFVVIRPENVPALIKRLQELHASGPSDE